MYKVLIIDDEAPARIAISRLGHWADYHITELYQETNGAAALKTMREIKPQIVFVDMQMPVMNGYEATKAIRRSSHELAKMIPIIAMTANAFKYFFKYPLGIEINLKGIFLLSDIQGRVW